MQDNDLRLDGNAAGGLLSEIFPFDMTAAEATCGGRGSMKPIGELILYQDGMGAILRSADCDTALVRITYIRGYLPARLERSHLPTFESPQKLCLAGVDRGRIDRCLHPWAGNVVLVERQYTRDAGELALHVGDHHVRDLEESCRSVSSNTPSKEKSL